MSGQGAFLEPGTVLAGRYRLVSPGVMEDVGAVHDAYDVVDDRPVTVLALPPGRLPGSEALRRLVDLQEAVSGLERPGLVPYEHAGILAGRPYLVRPALPHRSLAQILARGTPLEPGTALEIAVRLCETLAPLHKAGLVHGSLSPYSVLAGEETPPGARAPEWRVYVVDIGLLPALHGGEAPGKRAWGRSPYYTPEQAAGSPARPSADVYAVASLLYTMLAGRPAFRGADAELVALQHQRQEPPSLQILVPGISPRLAEVVGKGLEKEPANRYRNAGQMAQVLRGLWAAPPSPAPPAARGARLIVPPPPAQFDEPPPPRRRSVVLQDTVQEENPALANCLTVVLIILALAAVLGLIPLWRELQRRYTAPPALLTPAPEGWWQPDAPPAGTPGPLYAAPPEKPGTEPLSGLTPGCAPVMIRCAAWHSTALLDRAEPGAGSGPSGLAAPPRRLPAVLAGQETGRARPGPELEPGLFSDIIRCYPGVCRVLWSQDYGFFHQPGLL